MNVDDKKKLMEHSCILWLFWSWIYSSRSINKIKDKSITHNIFRILFDESVMCGFYCMAFIEYMFARQTLLSYTNLFSPNGYKKVAK